VPTILTQRHVAAGDVVEYKIRYLGAKRHPQIKLLTLLSKLRRH